MRPVHRIAVACTLLCASTAAAQAVAFAPNIDTLAPPGARYDARCSELAQVRVYSLGVEFPAVATARASVIAFAAERHMQIAETRHTTPPRVPAEVQKAMADAEKFFRGKGFAWNALETDVIGGDSSDGTATALMTPANWIFADECSALASGPILMVYQRPANKKP